MIFDYIHMALDSFSHRKLRSWLTMVGIFIGITAVVAIISLGQGLGVAINEQFEELGIDKIYIQPGASALGGATSVTMNENDRIVVQRSDGVRDTLGMAWTSARVQYKEDEIYGLVIAYNLDDGEDLWYDLQKGNIEQGRLLQKGDLFKAFVGYDFMQDDIVLKRAADLGDKIVINGFEFDIIGFQEDMGNSGDNQGVQISDEAYERVFGDRVQDDYMYIIARTKEGVHPDFVADNVERDLRKHRNVDEGDEDFTLQTAEEFMESFNSILMIVNVVIVGIAFISLIIGGIGIMNTMYTAVVERTQEIGIMKAIGARNSDVLLIFLIESGLLGLVGGLVGVLVGLGIAYAVQIGGTLWIGTPLLRMWWSWELIAASLAFSFLVGAMSGLAPAYRASRKQPVEALRYE